MAFEEATRNMVTMSVTARHFAALSMRLAGYGICQSAQNGVNSTP